MRSICLIAFLIAASPAMAEVKSSNTNGFEVEHKAVVAASSAEIYAELGRLGSWWDPAHSYSGKSENIQIELKAGGCWCERLDNGGSVEHMRIVYADPSVGVRAVGGLGPLQSAAVTGTMSWTFKPVGSGTELTQTYIAAGYVPGGIATMAAPVDQVLGQQFDRLKARLAK